MRRAFDYLVLVICFPLLALLAFGLAVADPFRLTQFLTAAGTKLRPIFEPVKCRGCGGLLTARANDEHAGVCCNCLGHLQRRGRFVTGQLPGYLATLHDNYDLLNAVDCLLGVPDVALYHSRLLLKDAAFSGAVEIHQDMPYFNGGRKISAFVPLAPMRASDGGLCFVKGSHKYGMMERGVIQLDKFPPMEHLCPDLEPGDVVFMDFLTWHYSGPCSSERPLMQITFQPAKDGSYDLPEPTLVSGQWQTSYFVKKGECVKPDAQ